MNDKARLITQLKDEFHRYDNILTTLSDTQANTRLYNDMTIKDMVAHLWGWQTQSIARMEAALHDREPESDIWPDEFDSEDDTDQINAWMHATYRDKSWSDVYSKWRDDFLHFIELAEAIPEDHLFDPNRYAWIEGYPLSAVLDGSYEHHHDDHLPILLAWRSKHIT